MMKLLMTRFKKDGDAEKELLRLLSGFSQMKLPVVVDEIDRWHPPIDVIETGKKLVIVSEIAGMREEDISIMLKDDIIAISGKREGFCDEPNPVFHLLEINYGQFERNIRLPKKFIGGNVLANYKNGFLKIIVEMPEKNTVSITVD